MTDRERTIFQQHINKAYGDFKRADSEGKSTHTEFKIYRRLKNVYEDLTGEILIQR